jgi:hypothetical protein
VREREGVEKKLDFSSFVTPSPLFGERSNEQNGKRAKERGRQGRTIKNFRLLSFEGAKKLGRGVRGCTSKIGY